MKSIGLFFMNVLLISPVITTDDSMEYPPLTYNGHSYYIPKGKFRDISLATEYCSGDGGLVAEINDAAEYEAIRSYIRWHLTGASDIWYIYIGGTDQWHDGHWVLPSTDQPLPYTDWYPSDEPYTGDEYNCIVLSKFNRWRMFSFDCGDHYFPYQSRFMCEKEA